MVKESELRGVSTKDLEGPEIDRRTTMKLLAAAGMSSGSMALAGCLGGNDSDPTPTEASGDGGGGGSTPTETSGSDGSSMSGGTITAAYGQDNIPNLYPHILSEGGQMIMVNIYNTLLDIKEDGRTVGDAAKDWTIENDTRYIFDLHDNIRFNNGDRATAETVKFTIDRLRNMPESPHYDKAIRVESTEAPDETTLIINLKEPFAAFLASLNRAKQFTHIVHPMIDDDQEAYDFQPTSTGPFYVADRQTGQSLTLKANPHYFKTDENGNQLPYLDEIQVDIIPERSTIRSGITGGQIDYPLHGLGPQIAQTAEQDDNLAFEMVDLAAWKALVPLCSKPHEHPKKAAIASYETIEEYTPSTKWEGRDLPTADVRVRQAISKAIDREQIKQVAYEGYSVTGHQILNKFSYKDWEHKPDWGQFYDPEGAKELLDEAGYTGSPRFEANLLSEVENERTATVMKQQLANVGIEVTLDIRQSSAFYSKIDDYEHMLSIYGGGVYDLDTFQSWWKQLRTPNEADASGSWQKGLWFNEEFDSITAKSAVETDPDRRAELQLEAAKVLNREVGYVLFEFTQQLMAWPTKLSGHIKPLGQTRFDRARVK